MQNIVKYYKLAKAGDKEAILYLLSNMGEGKLLKENRYLRLVWLTEVAIQGNKEAYKTLFEHKELVFDSTPLYIKPKYFTEKE